MTSRFRNERTTVPSVRIHLGHNGLSTTINWGRGQPTVIGNPRLSGPLPTDRFLIPGTRKDFGGGNVSDMTSAGLDSFKELLLGTRRREIEIKADLSKAKWQLRLARAVQTIGWVSLASVIAPVRKRANTAVAVRRSEITTLKDNLAATKISVNFDMETEIAEPHRRMQSTFDRLVSSQRSWSIQTEQRIDRVRARSLAGTVVSREHAICVGRLPPSLIQTIYRLLCRSDVRNRWRISILDLCSSMSTRILILLLSILLNFASHSIRQALPKAKWFLPMRAS